MKIPSCLSFFIIVAMSCATPLHAADQKKQIAQLEASIKDTNAKIKSVNSAWRRTHDQKYIKAKKRMEKTLKQQQKELAALKPATTVEETPSKQPSEEGGEKAEETVTKESAPKTEAPQPKSLLAKDFETAFSSFKHPDFAEKCSDLQKNVTTNVTTPELTRQEVVDILHVIADRFNDAKAGKKGALQPDKNQHEAAMSLFKAVLQVTTNTKQNSNYQFTPDDHTLIDAWMFKIIKKTPVKEEPKAEKETKESGKKTAKKSKKK